MTTLKIRISEDLKSAMKERAQSRVDALRLITAQIKQFEVDKRLEAPDTEVLRILTQMSKQRRDSIAYFQSANRNDLVEKEQFELDIIQTYLPEPLSEADVLAMIENALSELKETANMGLLMSKLKPEVQGRFDMTRFSTLVKERLSS